MQYQEENKEYNGIGTLSEKSIHSIIKDYLSPNKENQEIKVGRYVADIKIGNQIIEIQTQNFKKLINKIEYYLETGYNIKVVYPVIYERYTNWIDPISHKIVERRKSPIKGCIQDFLTELYWVYKYLENDKFDISIILINAEEYKYLDGYGQNSKKHATKIDKVPTKILNEIQIKTIKDLVVMVPQTLDIEFNSKDFIKHSKCRKKWIGSGIKLLRDIGVITVVRKEGNSFIYRRTKDVKIN